MTLTVQTLECVHSMCVFEHTSTRGYGIRSMPTTFCVSPIDVNTLFHSCF